MKWRWSVLIAGFALAGCSANVGGVVGTETFTGNVKQGMDGTGTMELHSKSGVNCFGDYVARNGTGGTGFLSCNDGRQARIQYTTTSAGVGYGYGIANTGDPVRFYFGMSPEQGARYIAAPPGDSSSKGGTGTGFFITRQGALLTNAHVVDKCKELTVASAGGTASSARVVAIDKANDLAVLQSNDQPVATASLRGARPVRLGETVTTYGFPLTGDLSSDGVLTSGSVSASSGMGDDTRYFQISVPIQPGNSGGALLDSTGAVIGVTSSGLNALYFARQRGTVPQNANFAIKVSVIRTFLESAGVSAETAAGGRDLSMPDIGVRARSFTVRVECKG
jgi:S1-C subfamily serine protease